ncbi:antibiotic biosynthesis monooxygenase [Solirubrobacter sp. CPCC 204708]|uniref:Antibiotic biosynthesis monooxygenase n=1 Tax=Solirubrobacter deserti TaxID=2282478 RepID=A0ABT4RRI0_9ACTN|nr:antibiotic biosynthesis monooxygenase [Solirubrobacter deserti]MBE2314797.1 antibiotic biosynthesis monooxygenase [Solirubrobacter deserti]MDA0141207.1 antibiotic biosynthesis monooxygenase [Solirubrobacter deserti]
MAIARIWRGTVPTARADEYTEYMNQTGIKDIRNTAGNLGVFLLRREEGEETHFQTISVWESEDAIEAFSGSKDRTARLEPKDEEFLIRSEPEAEHNVIASDPNNIFTG